MHPSFVCVFLVLVGILPASWAKADSISIVSVFDGDCRHGVLRPSLTNLGRRQQDSTASGLACHWRARPAWSADWRC